MKTKTAVTGHWRTNADGTKTWVKPHETTVNKKLEMGRSNLAAKLSAARSGPDIKEVTYTNVLEVTSQGKLDELQKLVNKLNKKAAKYGHGGYTMTSKTVGLSHLEDEFPELAEQRRLPMFPVFEVTIEGTPPKIIGDYSYVGILENSLGSDEALVFSHDHEKMLEVSEDIDWGQCDKCGKKRNRSKLLVIEDEDGNLLRVGGECAKDFLGTNFNIDSYTKDAADLFDLVGLEREKGIGGPGKFSPSFYDPKLIAQFAAAYAATGGWVSYKKGVGTPTAALVSRAMYGTVDSIMEEGARIGAFDDSNLERVDAMFDWIENLSEEELEANQYYYDLHQMAKSNVVVQKRIGMMASLAVAYENHLTRQKENEAKAEAASSYADSKHLGEIGGKLTKKKVTVTDVKYLREGEYGPRYLVKLADEDNNVIISWVGEGKLTDLDEGAEIVMSSGKVEDHDEFNGIKQTTLSNIRFKPAGRLGEIVAGKFTKEEAYQMLEDGKFKEIEAAATWKNYEAGKIDEAWVKAAVDKYEGDEDHDNYPMWSLLRNIENVS